MNKIYRTVPILDSKTQRTAKNPATATHEVRRADLLLLLQHRMRPSPLSLQRRGMLF